MAQNPNGMSLLDMGQIVKRVYDPTNDELRVQANITTNISGAQEVLISQVDDSIRLGDGTNLVTSTTVSSHVGLDVNLIGGVVSGTFQSSGLSTSLKNSVMTITDVASKVPATPLTNRNALSIRVWGSNTVYFGGSTVTAAAGYPRLSLEEIQMDIKDNSSVELWAICASGQTSEVRILEVA